MLQIRILKDNSRCSTLAAAPSQMSMSIEKAIDQVIKRVAPGQRRDVELRLNAAYDVASKLQGLTLVDVVKRGALVEQILEDLDVEAESDDSGVDEGEKAWQ